MHELGVAEGVLDIVRAHVPPGRARDVRAVRVRIGDWSGVLADSLEFCFGAIVAGTPFASAALDLERVPALGRCSTCGHEFELDRPGAGCPMCLSALVSMSGGRELQVVSVELDEPEADR